MHISSSGSKERKSADVMVVPVWQEAKRPLIACEGKEFEPLAKFPLDEGDFRAGKGRPFCSIGIKEKRSGSCSLGWEKKNPVCPTRSAAPTLWL